MTHKILSLNTSSVPKKNKTLAHTKNFTLEDDPKDTVAMKNEESFLFHKTNFQTMFPKNPKQKKCIFATKPEVLN